MSRTVPLNCKMSVDTSKLERAKICALKVVYLYLINSGSLRRFEARVFLTTPRGKANNSVQLNAPTCYNC